MLQHGTQKEPVAGFGPRVFKFAVCHSTICAISPINVSSELITDKLLPLKFSRRICIFIEKIKILYGNLVNNQLISIPLTFLPSWCYLVSFEKKIVSLYYYFQLGWDVFM